MSAFRWMFDNRSGPADRQIPRWIFLRALGLIYFSAFYSLIFQINGLIGPNGILPANVYLQAVARVGGWQRMWIAPSLLWFSSSRVMLLVLCWAGILAAVALVLNFWPRLSLIVCFVCFLSFVSTAQDFSGYQSDGMLLEAGFISIFFAPRGLRPRLGELSPPSRAALFLLLWEWFRIYFESGVVKLLSGDPEWRNLSAMDEYYQNGPLPTWIGWYLQHLPHWFHWLTALGTLVMELVLVLMLFLPRRFRIVLFVITTVWQLGVIGTANYTFLNYLVLSLGFLLLDDNVFGRIRGVRLFARVKPVPAVDPEESTQTANQHPARAVLVALQAVMLTWVFYVSSVELIWMFWRGAPLPSTPVTALEPFRIANQYGLFAVMTRGRYEIEFQGSNDGQNWQPYLFRYKPQLLNEAPRIYAPYQPRFDWNLWFASLGTWRDNMFVASTEERLLNNDRDVLNLFRANPFSNSPPKEVRAVLWQYWFTSWSEKHATGNWWRRQYLGTYAPTLTQNAEGKLVVVQWPSIEEGHQ